MCSWRYAWTRDIVVMESGDCWIPTIHEHVSPAINDAVVPTARKRIEKRIRYRTSVLTNKRNVRFVKHRLLVQDLFVPRIVEIADYLDLRIELLWR